MCIMTFQPTGIAVPGDSIHRIRWNTDIYGRLPTGISWQPAPAEPEPGGRRVIVAGRGSGGGRQGVLAQAVAEYALGAPPRSRSTTRTRTPDAAGPHDRQFDRTGGVDPRQPASPRRDPLRTVAGRNRHRRSTIGRNPRAHPHTRDTRPHHTHHPHRRPDRRHRRRLPTTNTLARTRSDVTMTDPTRAPHPPVSGRVPVPTPLTHAPVSAEMVVPHITLTHRDRTRPVWGAVGPP